MEPLKPGQDPRQALRRHSERGLKRYEYTIETVAAAMGVTEHSVRSYCGGTLKSWLRLDDLSLVAAKIQAMRRKLSRTLNYDEIYDLEDRGNRGREEWIELWRNRWPVIELYSCPVDSRCWPSCGPGFCPDHGGSRQAITLSGQYFQVLTDVGYKPMHRVIAGSPEGMDVHHKDHNTFNNRPSNLEAMTRHDHFAQHGHPKGSVARSAPMTALYIAAHREQLIEAAAWCSKYINQCHPVIGAPDAEYVRTCDRHVIWDDPALARRWDIREIRSRSSSVILLAKDSRAAVEAGGSPWESRWRVGRSALAFSTALD